jgi:hypothetical protein
MVATGSFEFFDNYVESVLSRQPELYSETARICNDQFATFADSQGRKPVVVDIGCAGVIPYDLGLVEHLYIIDLYDPPGASSRLPTRPGSRATFSIPPFLSRFTPTLPCSTPCCTIWALPRRG